MNRQLLTLTDHSIARNNAALLLNHAQLLVKELGWGRLSDSGRAVPKADPSKLEVALAALACMNAAAQLRRAFKLDMILSREEELAHMMLRHLHGSGT